MPTIDMNLPLSTSYSPARLRRNLREFSRLGIAFGGPEYVARAWAENLRDSWVTTYVRDARARLYIRQGVRRTHWERLAAFPSRLRVSATLEKWLNRIEESPNAKAARVATAILRAMESRVAHAQELFGNFFASREREGLISYCPADRTQGITPDGKWERAGRVEIKPAKFARGILRHPERFRDDEYAAFAEAFGGVEAGEKIEWRILTTEAEIDAAYNALNWGSKTPDNEGGDLRIQSCMWGQDVGRFYERAGARVLLGVQRGIYVSRVVLWETREIGTVADRLYASPSINEACRAYIREQGWAKKEADSNSSSGWIQADGSTIHRTLTVEPPRSLSCCRTFPYMDSFRWQYGDLLRTIDDGDWDYEYASTSGGREEGHRGQLQDVDGNWIYEDDAYSVGGDYYHCDDERIVMCHFRDEHILRDDAYEIELGGRLGTIYIHEDQVSRA